METIDTRNQTAHIDPDDLYAILVKANAGIEDRDRKIEDQKAIIYAMSGGQGERIVSANKTLQKRIAEKDQEISKQREVIERFESHESTVVGNLRLVNTRLNRTIDEQDERICDLDSELDVRNDILRDRVNEIDELKRKDRHWKWADGVSEGAIESMTGLANDNQMKIDELEDKLAEKQDAFSKSMHLTTSLQTRIRELEDERDEAIDISNTRLRATIERLEHKLAYTKRRATETHELLQDMTSRDWEQSNKIAGMKTDHWTERVVDRKTIKELKSKLVISDKASKISDEDAEYWWCIHNEDDAFIHRLLDGNNTFNGVLDDCRSDVKMLRAQLVARKKDSEMLENVVDEIRDWESCPILSNDHKSIYNISDIVVDYIDREIDDRSIDMNIPSRYRCQQMNAMLVNIWKLVQKWRENEPTVSMLTPSLDTMIDLHKMLRSAESNGVFGDTEDLNTQMTECEISQAMDHQAIRTLNQHIIGLEAEISAQKKASKTVDKWHFHVGDKVVSTDHARHRESIYINGYVVRVEGDVLLVDVGGHIESVNFSWMEKV